MAVVLVFSVGARARTVRRGDAVMCGDEGGVVADAVDEVRVAAVLEALAEHVEARRPA